MENDPIWLTKARQYLYVRENTPNRSPEIDMFNRYAKVSLGSPWCASFVGYVLHQSNAIQPICEASAILYYRKGYKTYSAQDVINKKAKVEKGDIVVFRRGNGWTGHVGFANDDWKYIEGETIEGNTSADEHNSQYNGDGIYIKYRKIIPENNFRIIGFSKVLLGEQNVGSII
jgi:hypothetical protein